MSIEAQLTTALKAICPRTFPLVAPTSTERPYVTYQLIGGRALGYLDNSAADKRHSLVQVDVFADTLLSAKQTIRAIEDALRASAVFTATPEAEPRDDYDHDMLRFRSSQDFSIYSTR